LHKTAAVIIIGNEILSGKVRDENSHFLASHLRELGVDLRLITVIPDEVDEIAGAVASSSGKYDFVFTSGGVGPTHDDVTMEGVAKAFGLKTVTNQAMRDVLVRRCGVELAETALRMAELPEGAELIEIEGMNFPPVLVRNVYVFPGIPEFLRKKFSALEERFRGMPFHVSRLYINEEECLIAETLSSVAAEFPGVSIGSYPKPEEREFKVMVTVESKDALAVAMAVEKLLRQLPAHIVVGRA
jgi:molybdenum cofactor synthesis domain-containing protein